MPAKQEIIKNLFEGENTQLDKVDRKYLKYFQDFQNKATLEAFESFRTKDLSIIENTLKQLSQSVVSNTYIIGIGCIIIERERLFLKAGFRSYFEYAQFIFNDSELPTSTIGAAKIIMERYIDYNKQLKKAGFKLEGNSNKLLFIEEALKNHDEDEVFQNIVEYTFRKFKDWAQRRIFIQHKPEKEIQVNAEIKGNKLLIDGKNILNFPKGLSKPIKELIKEDLQRTFSIREGGHEPYIISTYSRGEQIAIDNFLKGSRAKK